MVWFLTVRHRTHLSHSCSATEPITRGTVNLGLTYMPTAIPIPDGSATSRKPTARCLHLVPCTKSNLSVNQPTALQDWGSHICPLLFQSSMTAPHPERLPLAFSTESLHLTSFCQTIGDKGLRYFLAGALLLCMSRARMISGVMLCCTTSSRHCDAGEVIRGKLALGCVWGWRSCICVLALARQKDATGRIAASTAATAQNGTTCGGRAPPFTWKGGAECWP